MDAVTPTPQLDSNTPGTARHALLIAALFVFTAHAGLMADWLVDDAGISFAYARNLARGHGLVSQPGVAPVEGFSNPLWTLALAPLFWLRAFAPETVKLLSLALVAATFALMALGRDRDLAAGPSLWLAGLAPLLLGLNTSFVVWTTSGLENPLLVFLLALSAILAMRIDRAARPARLDIAAGAVAGALALTRPDAVVYAVVYPLALAVALRTAGLAAFRRRALRYGGCCGALVAAYELFRYAYFGDWVPNTFHAKVRASLLSFGIDRFVGLVTSATGLLAPVVVALLGWGLTLLFRQRVLGLRRVVLLLHLVLAVAVYWVLPPDWMGEYRFATAFFLFFFWLLGDVLAGLFDGLATARSPVRWLLPAAALLLLVQNAQVHAARSTEFALNPTVPFSRISEFGRAYETLASSVSTARPSLLAPDLGGTLFESRRLRVYDLVGLCDRTVARTLMGRTDAFHDYVFTTARPTFIHTHGAWSGWARFHEDPRFDRDYVALHEVWAAPAQVRDESGAEPWSADYVRRDAVPTSQDLMRLRRDFVALGLDQPLP
jgi:hypothetical protein